MIAPVAAVSKVIDAQTRVMFREEHEQLGAKCRQL